MYMFERKSTFNILWDILFDIYVC